MGILYFLVAQCDTWLQSDPNGYLSHYFIEESGFTHAFFIALGVAIIVSAIFYGWIGMAVSRLANLGVWLIALLVDAITTFFMTMALIIGNSDAVTGIFNSISEQKGVLSQQIPVNDVNAQNLLNSTTNQLVDNLSNGCDVTYSLYVENVLFSLILMFFISLCVKRLTKYAVYVPF